MPSDCRAAPLTTSYDLTYAPAHDLTDAHSGVCTICVRGEQVQHLEVYRHGEMSWIFVLFA